MEQFDYGKAVRRLEEIADKVEDPSTGVNDIDKYIKETEELVGKCREYLRSVRKKLDTIE